MVTARLVARVGQMLGSTWRVRIPHVDTPEVRAASTYCSARTRRARMRVRRATTAEAATPIATVTVAREAPKPATMSIARSSVGKAMSTSSSAEATSSAHGRASAITRPTLTPMRVATATAPRPTTRAMRAPTIMREARSWPRRSVPRRWSAEKPSRRPPLVSSIGYGSHASETRAMSASTPTRSAPTKRDSGIRRAFTGDLPC